MEYFIIDENNKQAGPFSLEQLAEKAITPETLVWAQGMKDWTPAWKVAELKTALEAAEAIRDNAAANNEQSNGGAGQNGNAGFGTNGNGAQQNGGAAVPPNYHNGFNQQGNGYQGNNNGFNPGNNFNQGNHYQPEEPKRKSNKKLWKIILGLIIFILLVFAITNPSADTHKDKVRTEMTKVVDKATATSDNNFFTQGIRSVAKMLAGTAIDSAMDQLFEYHNYILFSKGTVNLDNKEHTVSFGILGKVYTLNADDMIKALEDAGNIDIEESTSTSDDSNALDDNSTSSSSDDNSSMDATGDDNSSDGDAVDGLGASVQKKLEDKANQAIDKAADKVSKKVEEQINKKLNEAAADSSKIEKVIDKLLELI